MIKKNLLLELQKWQVGENMKSIVLPQIYHSILQSVHWRVCFQRGFQSEVTVAAKRSYCFCSANRMTWNGKQSPRSRKLGKTSDRPGQRGKPHTSCHGLLVKIWAGRSPEGMKGVLERQMGFGHSWVLITAHIYHSKLWEHDLTSLSFYFLNCKVVKYPPKELLCVKHNPWQKVVTEQIMVMVGADTAASQ